MKDAILVDINRKENLFNMRKNINKIVGLTLCIGMLTGCAQTPESSLVKPKGSKVENAYTETEGVDMVNEDSSENTKDKNTAVRTTIRDLLNAPETYKSQTTDDSAKLVVNTDATVEIPDVEKISAISVTPAEVTQDLLDRITDVLAVVDIPKALETPLQVDMGLDYIFPTNELLGNMVSADQPAMKTIFNVDNEYQLATENWLKNYTTNTDTALDYLSKVTLRQTFDGMINMYRLVGGALCAILALIGILNFINSMMTSILSRYKELAMLQSVGMTGRQVKQMLMIEGIGYSALGLICSLLISIVGSLTVVRMMGAELSYFTWHFTLLPVFLCVIPLVFITAFVPLVCYNKMAQKTVVERLRIAE